MAQTFFQEDEILGKAYDGRLARRLWNFIHPYQRTVFITALFACLMVVVDLLAPFLTQVAIDQYIALQKVRRRSLSAERERGVLLIAVVFLLTLCVGFGLRYFQNYLLSVVGQRVMYDMRSDMFRHLQSLSLSFFDRNPVGRLHDAHYQRCGRAQRVVLFWLGLAPRRYPDAWDHCRHPLRRELAARADRLCRHPAADLCHDGLPALHAREFSCDSCASGAHQRQRRREYLWDAGGAALQPPGPQLRYFDDLNRDYMKVSVRSLFFFALFLPVVNVFAAVATALIIRVGGAQVLAIPQALTLGALVAFLQYVERFFLPVRDLADKYTVLQSAMASSERIFRVLDEPISLEDPESAAALQKVRGEIEFRDVWFAYNPGEWVSQRYLIQDHTGRERRLRWRDRRGKDLAD